MYPWSLAQRSSFSMSENQTLLRNTKNPIKSWMTVQPVGPSTHVSKFKPQWYYYLPANFCDVQRNKWDRNLVQPPECTRSHDRREEAAGSLSPALPSLCWQEVLLLTPRLPTQQSMQLQRFSKSILGKVCSVQTWHSCSCPSQTLQLCFSLRFLLLRDSRTSPRSFASYGRKNPVNSLKKKISLFAWILPGCTTSAFQKTVYHEKMLRRKQNQIPTSLSLNWTSPAELKGNYT